LTPDAPGFKVCYKHPKEVAVRDCALCGRPICKQCASESGDPKLCLTCKQDTMLHGDRLLKEAQDQKPGSQPAARQTPFEVGEVTVLDDGTVVQPEAPPTLIYELEGDAGEPVVPPLALDEQAAYDFSQVRQAAEETALATTEGPAREVIEEAEPATSKAGKSVMGREPRTGVWSQMLYAGWRALAVGALVAGAWLLIAFFGKQWTQISVFTLGIAVPWTLFNATTRRKYLGTRVWREEPPVIFMSAVSSAIVIAFTLLIEVFARWVIFGTKFPMSDFAQRYFRTTDWILIVCGLMLSALTPFVLKFGADLSAPSLRRKAPHRTGQEAVEELDQEPGEELEPGAENLEPDTEEEPGESE